MLIITIITLTFSDYAGQFLAAWIGDEVDLAQNGDNLAIIIALTFSLVVLTWHLAVIIGLWLLKRWAWFLVMIQLGLSMALCLWLYFQGERPYVYMWLNVIMVFYLNQSEVQHAFAHKRKAQQEML